MKKLFKESLTGQRIKIFVLFTFMIAQILISLLIPVVLQEYIDNVYTNTVGKMLILVTAYLGLNLIVGGVHVLNTYLSENFGWNVLNRVRLGMLSKILDYDQHFYNANSTGTVLEYVDRDINTLSYFINSKMLETIINLGMTVGILIVILNKNLVIGLIFLIYTAASFFVIFRMTKVDKNSLDKYHEEASFHLGKYGEWIDARSDIEALGEYDYISRKMESMDPKLKNAETAAQTYLYRIWAFTLLLVTISNGIILFASGNLFFQGNMSIGMVYLMFTYSNMLKVPFENFQSQLQAFVSARTVWKRMDKVLKYKSEVKEGKEKITGTVKKVQFGNVRYVYPKGMENAFECKELYAKQGEILGVSGYSGSGKSTFCKLLCKMLEPTEGVIFVNHTELSCVSVGEWRSHIAYVSTEAPTFSGTLRDNFTLYRKKITDKSLLEMLAEYNMIRYFEELGNDFLDVETDQTKLSNGQKQLISLVRAYFLEREIMIFDEAASKIDPIIRKQFFTMIQNMKVKKVVIIVSHEKETLEICDRVVVFEKPLK